MTQDSSDFSLYIDVSVFAAPLRPYVEELLERLGPEADVPDDPLTALAQSHAAPADRPADAVMARLLPDGVMEDEEAAVEFRRFSHGQLRTRKRQDATYFLSVLDEGVVQINRLQTLSLLGALNDVRLMLGTSLMVTQDAEVEVESPDEEAAYLAYRMATYLQEGLVESLDSSLD